MAKKQQVNITLEDNLHEALDRVSRNSGSNPTLYVRQLIMNDRKIKKMLDANGDPEKIAAVIAEMITISKEKK